MFIVTTKRFLIDGIDVPRLIFAWFLSIGLLLLLVTTLKIRYYIIYDTQLKFYSFWYPFGKTLDFYNYIGG
jgi:hypothetical protein